MPPLYLFGGSETRFQPFGGSTHLEQFSKKEGWRALLTAVSDWGIMEAGEPVVGAFAAPGVPVRVVRLKTREEMSEEALQTVARLGVAPLWSA